MHTGSGGSDKGAPPLFSSKRIADPINAALELLLHIHYPQGVKRIDNGGAKATEGIGPAFGDRLQLVQAPRILHVSCPAMRHCLLHRVPPPASLRASISTCSSAYEDQARSSLQPPIGVTSNPAKFSPCQMLTAQLRNAAKDVYGIRGDLQSSVTSLGVPSLKHLACSTCRL